MSLFRQILVISMTFLVSFIYLRSFLYGIKRYQLNTSAFKKRKKGETILEWFLYTRYKDVIPKGWRIFYYAFIIFNFSCLLVCVILSILKVPQTVGTFIAKLSFINCIWMTVVGLLFWSKKPGYAYERWIQKKRGQDPANKKK